ncbi:LVIVD repeat-containing protein [Halocatena salina]|uniref:Uncharacterized protein n=1 Tax=Halocatena salina TaxID=2934340 RepID=A0A8U0A3K5_9EURY|nr:hypothetical protein [Halocatena salina]UPM43379.1 hypothetical protein MW046_02780 [Halocatena salina]
MIDRSRRDFLRYTGIVTTAIGSARPGTARRTPETNARASHTVPGRLELLGHAFLDNPPGIYSNGVLRDDGRYGLLGGYYGEGGSFLVDLEDLSNPTQAHRLRSPMTNRQNDVAFDARDGLYYRTQEPNTEDGERGFQVVDYGYATGTVSEPTIVADVDTPRTGVHHIESHPEAPLVYAVDKKGNEPGVLTYDTSDPTDPVLIDVTGPYGYAHDITVEADRDLLHVAYIDGRFVGYVVFDIADPTSPTERGRVDYADRPDYEAIDLAGFEACHSARFDPERKLAVLSDERGTGIPGGKHVFDIGWGDGSPEDPVHLGFTHSPNATEQGDDEQFFWTTHFHDVASCGDTTLLVDGGYHEGVWIADITDPRDPTPSQQFQTRKDEHRAKQLGSGPIIDSLDSIHPPFVWSAEYNETRGFVFASDSITGAYVFDISADSFEFRTIEEELARSFEPTGEIGARELDLARHYNEEHATVPNTGGKVLTDEVLAEIERRVDAASQSATTM